MALSFISRPRRYEAAFANAPLAYEVQSSDNTVPEVFCVVNAGYPPLHPNHPDFPIQEVAVLRSNGVISFSVVNYRFNVSGIIQSLFDLKPPSIFNGWQLLVPYQVLFNEDGSQTPQIQDDTRYATAGRALPYPQCPPNDLASVNYLGMVLSSRIDHNLEAFDVSSYINENGVVGLPDTVTTVVNQIEL